MKSSIASVLFACLALSVKGEPSSFYELANTMPDGPQWNNNWELGWNHDGPLYGAAYAERFRTWEVPVSVTKVELALLNFNQNIGTPSGNKNLTIEIVGGNLTTPDPNQVILTVAINPEIQLDQFGAFPPPVYAVSAFLTTPTLLSKQRNYWLLLRATTQNFTNADDDVLTGWSGGSGNVAWTVSQYQGDGVLAPFPSTPPTVSPRGAFAIYVNQDPQIGSVPEPTTTALAFAGVVLCAGLILRKRVDK